jgi:hypothetical protein
MSSSQMTTTKTDAMTVQEHQGMMARKEIHNRSYKDPLRHLHPSSAVIMAGYRSDLSEAAIKPPVFRSSTFEFRSAEEGEMYFRRAYGLPGSDGQSPGLVYSRLNNPNTGTYVCVSICL